MDIFFQVVTHSYSEQDNQSSSTGVESSDYLVRQVTENYNLKNMTFKTWQFKKIKRVRYFFYNSFAHCFFFFLRICDRGAGCNK